MLHTGGCSGAVHRLPAGKSVWRGYNWGRALRQFRHADRRMGHVDAAPQTLAGACPDGPGKCRDHPAGAEMGCGLELPLPLLAACIAVGEVVGCYILRELLAEEML